MLPALVKRRVAHAKIKPSGSGFQLDHGQQELGLVWIQKTFNPSFELIVFHVGPGKFKRFWVNIRCDELPRGIEFAAKKWVDARMSGATKKGGEGKK